MSEVTRVYYNGQHLGSYVAFKNGGGVCVPAAVNVPSPNQNQAEPAEPSTWEEISAFFQGLLFASPLSGCAEDVTCGPTCQQLQDPDAGISLNPPDAGEVDPENRFDSGAARVDGGTILPTDDAGGIILPDDVWFEITGEGRFFQESPVLLETPYLTGAGLQDLSLYLEIGTDSTKVTGMPNIDEDRNGVPDNYFPGLINTNQLSEEDLAHGEDGCPEAGYESFVVCPSYEENRLKVYIGTITIEGYRYVGGEFEKIGETTQVLTTPEELYNTNPEEAVPLPTVASPYRIDIPQAYNESGELYLKVKLNLIVDARPADQNAHYQTSLLVKTRAH